ncbi:MAG TPA: MotA/TolQ/ExbB proton channel family protein [Gammaproteobacteria bacterium]|jgi:biopolymer transport protein ExbB
MFNVLQLLEKLQAFLEQGGALLVVIMTATFFLWLLILERHYYFLAVHKRVAKRIAGQWRARRDKSSWYARMIRLQLLSIARIRTEHNLGRIRLIVVIAPLLGLLGTVTGMIDVFDVMASSGSGNARGMAAGVSKATIPTMAGMVVSLCGMLFGTALQRRAGASVEALANTLDLEATDEKA